MFQLRGLHHRVGVVLRRVVAVDIAFALLVIAAGRDRRRALHAQDALLFRVGDCGIRRDIDRRMCAMDEIAPI